MRPYYSDGSVTLYRGDCLDILPTIPDASINSIVTDPPYGIGFMGKAWDDLPPGEEWARECLRVLKPGGHLLAFGGTRTWHRLAVTVEDAGFEIRDSIAWMYGTGFPKNGATLKPAHEPIVVARKKLAAPRTGLLQIDACRVETSEADARAMERVNTPGSGRFTPGKFGTSGADGFKGEAAPFDTRRGRWPANVALDESQAAALDEQSGDVRAGGHRSAPTGASRFFYVAKASKRERPIVDGVAHPTVKPLALMRWLVRLATPPGGLVLDPFAGSGTTIEAALLEGMNPIGIEREAEYLPLIHARLARVATRDAELFDGGAA